VDGGGGFEAGGVGGDEGADAALVLGAGGERDDLGGMGVEGIGVGRGGVIGVDDDVVDDGVGVFVGHEKSPGNRVTRGCKRKAGLKNGSC
jgi:hypothetical protein